MRFRALHLGAGLALLACGDSTGPPGEGSLIVSVSTTGGDLDLDGYHLSVDGNVAVPIATNGEQTFLVSVGSHNLEIEGVAHNCEVSGAGTRHSATVTAGGTVHVTFAVGCALTGVRIVMTSTGLDFDPNGIRVWSDIDTPMGTVSANGELVISRLMPGTISILLTDVAPNCRFLGAASVAVNVENRKVAEVAFALECGATTGAIRVEVTTTGRDPDAEYRALLNGNLGAAALIVGGAGVLSNVPAGAHFVSLGEIASNCSVVGEATPTADVTAGGLVRDTAVVRFTVSCALDSGTIRVTTTIAGDTPGERPAAQLIREYCGWYGCGYYEVLEAADLAGDGTASFTPRSGGYLVRLAPGSSCSVSGPDVSDLLQVAPGSEHQVHFDLSCGPPAVEVSVTTTGSMPDTEYQANLWYWNYYYYYPALVASGAMAANSTRTFEGQYQGYYHVELSGVAPNCTVGPANPTPEFFLGMGTTQSVAFTVTCSG